MSISVSEARSLIRKAKRRVPEHDNITHLNLTAMMDMMSILLVFMIIIGAIGLTFFIRDSWWADAGTKVAGWGIGNQLLVQIKAVGATILFAAVMTLVIGFIVEKTIGLRPKESDEKEGLDHSLHSERGYGLNNLN